MEETVMDSGRTTKTAALAVLVWPLLADALTAAPFTQTLISVEQNVAIPSWEVAGATVTPGCPHAWSVRKLTLHGGKQEGVDLVVVDNGALRFTVVPTRGMGILHVMAGDVRLGWDSPVREVVHPKFMNLHHRGGLGWLEGFNEWLCRCGLEFAGHPGTDSFVTNTGDEATMDLTLHGRIANLPAQEVTVVVDRTPPYRIRICGRVDEKLFFGPKLELHTEISTVPGSTALRITDVVSNVGGQAQEFQLIYHTNYGQPLLEAGSSFVAPVERITPFNARAAEGIGTYFRFEGPTPGFIEQVYCLRLRAGENGRTIAMLANEAMDRAVSITYNPEALPCFTLWKNTTSEKEGYVTGLEPGTSYSYNRRIERKQGRVPKLEPGASRTVTLDVAVHAGKDQVQTVLGRIAAIQGTQTPVIDTSPPEVD
jgi:hypothetical protein